MQEQALNRLLDALLDQPEPSRLQWIERLPSHFDCFKVRLRSLISRAPLDTLPKLLQQEKESLLHERLATRVGPYELQRLIGSGGMGTVWLARRADGLLERDVALKLPHGLHGTGLPERMASERRILATLCHPNIGRLYDAGIAGDGRPYLALEYIEGQPIDAYCAEHDVDLRDRLRLFEQVANAVAYAHGKLVVHRDIKPANILVTADRQVRLLDFGIAKLLEHGQAEDTALTLLSGRALTPEYASPEQVAGEPITVASDVYSLGVVLYELLTGTKPFSARRSRRASAEAVAEFEPKRPSECASSVATARQLRGDLDTIVLKALKEEPQERYATVNALAEDIARYLDGRPVLARPDSLAYRASRFVDRHRVGVAIAGAVTLSLTVAAGIALSQARAAVEQRERAGQVKDFVVSVLREADPYSRPDGRAVTAADRLLQARSRALVELRGQPEVEIELLGIIGEGLRGLGQNEQAAETLRQALQRAATQERTDPLMLLRLYRLLSEVNAAGGRFDVARRNLDSSLALMESIENVPAAEAMAVQLQRSALAVEDARFDEALKASRLALQLAARNPGISAQAMAQAWRYSAVVHRAQGDADLAVEEYGRAYELAMRAHGGDVRHPFVMETRMGYARALLMQNRWQEAAVHMQAAVNAASDIFGPEADLTGNFLISLGDVQVKLGLVHEGVDNCRRSLAIQERVAQGTRAHAARLRLLGKALLAAGEIEEASSVLARGIAMRAHLADHLELPDMRAAHARSLILLGRLAEAEQELDSIDTTRVARRTEIVIDVLLGRGMLARSRGQHDAAVQLLHQAMEMARALPGSQYVEAQVLGELGAVEIARDRAVAAVGYLDTAVARLGQVQQRKSPVYAGLVSRRAQANEKLGRYEQVVADRKDARNFWRGFSATSVAARQAEREAERTDRLVRGTPGAGFSS